jgi:hypothetical protein
MFVPNRLFFFLLLLSRCESVTYTDDDNNNHRGNGTLIERLAREIHPSNRFTAPTHFAKSKHVLYFFFHLDNGLFVLFTTFISGAYNNIIYARASKSYSPRLLLAV